MQIRMRCVVAVHKFSSTEIMRPAKSLLRTERIQGRLWDDMSALIHKQNRGKYPEDIQ